MTGSAKKLLRSGPDLKDKQRRCRLFRILMDLRQWRDRQDEIPDKAEITIPFEGVEYQKTYSFDSITDKLYMKMHNMTIKTEILRENQIHIDEHCYYVDTEYIILPDPVCKDDLLCGWICLLLSPWTGGTERRT